jgi:UTP--glucose-1-phosphate uridylyltransferase
MRVTRALIPCGGRGTRMAALTGGKLPKELLPVAGVPVLQRVVDECVASGVKEILIVLSPEKVNIRDFFTGFTGARIQFGIQHQPLGLADAISVGAEFAKGMPLAIALPDNLFLSEVPALAQVISAYVDTGKNVVGIVQIRAEEAATRGPTSVYEGDASGDLFLIRKIPEKGAKGNTFDPGAAAAAFTGIGRYVFDAEVFSVIEDVRQSLPEGVEVDDIPVMQRLLGEKKLVGRFIRGDFLDVGLPSGYAEANERLQR